MRQGRKVASLRQLPLWQLEFNVSQKTLEASVEKCLSLVPPEEGESWALIHQYCQMLVEGFLLKEHHLLVLVYHADGQLVSRGQGHPSGKAIKFCWP